MPNTLTEVLLRPIPRGRPANATAHHPYVPVVRAAARPSTQRPPLRNDLDPSFAGRVVGILDRKHGLEGGDRDGELVAIGLAGGQVLQH